MCRWKFEFSAIDPNDPSATWQVGITEEHYRRIINHGHEKSQARILLVGEVLDNSISLYGGWNRLRKDGDCFVYVGKPKDDYHKLDPMICVPSPPGMVFLVFVLEGGTIDEWTWRKHADGDISAPLGMDGEPIWLRNQN